MKRLLVLLAAGAAIATPAFAQKITVSTDQKAGTAAKAGDKVNVCIAEDADVKNVAAFQFNVTFPAGWTVPLSDPSDPGSGTFNADKGVPAGALNVTNYDKANNQFVVGLVGTKNVSGPNPIGCFELDATATAASGNIGLTGSANDKDSKDVPFTAMGAQIQGAAPAGTTTTGTTGTATTGTTGTACPDLSHKAGQLDVADVSAAKAGDKVDVAINVNGLTGVASFQFTINYDPKVFTFKSSDANDDSADFVLGPVEAGGFLAVNGKANPGQIAVALANTKNSKAGGNLMTFPLVVNANAPSPTKSEITLSAVTVVDKDSNSVNATIGNGVVTVGTCGAGTATTGTATTGTATTGTTTTGTTTGSKKGKAHSGDFKGNGKIDVDDVKTAINILFGIDTDAEDKGIGDVNSDNVVDLIDIRIILQMAVKG